MSVEINPKELHGEWDQGFALDVHTTRSTFKGYGPSGRPDFDTTRSALGELVYRLKYRFFDPNVRDSIVETVIEFIAKRQIVVDIIVPMPPSNTKRTKQPVIEVAREIGKRVEIPVCEVCVQKVKETPQLKDVRDYSEKKKILADAFRINAQETKDKRIMLFDDLYDTGATMNIVGHELKATGGARDVFVLALTWARN